MTSTINIIDFEASGLHESSYPIEVAVLVGTMSYEWLIQPEPDWQYWCSTAESMHGLQRNQLFKDGLPAHEVAYELNRAFGGSSGVVHSDAANWDSFWMKRLFKAAKLTPNFRIASLFEYLDRKQARSFESAKEELAESGQYRHHRAAEDVKMIYKAYLTAVADK